MVKIEIYLYEATMGGVERDRKRLHGMAVGDTCCGEESSKTWRGRALVKSCYVV